jgi:hypothetical protein
VDFYFTMGAEDLTAVLPSAAYFPVIQRGAKLWYQRPGVDLRLPDPQPAPAARPAEAEFLALVSAMFLYGHKMAKLMRRGDVVRAKMVLESVLRPPLLTLIAWHAQAMFGPERDTWYNGRFLAEWADPRVLAALPNTYGGYSAEETWRSLFGVLILSRWLAEETAVCWHFSFPRSRRRAGDSLDSRAVFDKRQRSPYNLTLNYLILNYQPDRQTLWAHTIPALTPKNKR